MCCPPSPTPDVIAEVEQAPGDESLLDAAPDHVRLARPPFVDRARLFTLLRFRGKAGKEKEKDVTAAAFVSRHLGTFDSLVDAFRW